MFIVCLMAGLCLVATAVRAHAAGARGRRTFYVAADGSDANSGTTPARAWRTVTRVNDETLGPGDRILFRGGDTFSDATLMPGQGFDASGIPRRPITFGSYGGGTATLTQGIWLGTSPSHPAGPAYLRFTGLALGPVRGFQGTGNHISLVGLRISNLLPPAATQENGIQTQGSDWLIAHNTIERVGGSGMLLGANANGPGDPPGGTGYLIHNNVIADTGLDSGIGYPTHGIYLKVARARIVANAIDHFQTDGVSVRYRDATIIANHISGGQIGIAWYQYDRVGGRSRFLTNHIMNMSVAGIFVCGVAEACLRPLETFEIAGNTMSDVHGRRLNLQPTAGRYLLRAPA